MDSFAFDYVQLMLHQVCFMPLFLKKISVGVCTRSFLFVTCLHLLIPLATSSWMLLRHFFSVIYHFVIITILGFSKSRVSKSAVCFYASCNFGIHVFSFLCHCMITLHMYSCVHVYRQCRHHIDPSVNDARNRFLRRNKNQTIRWPEELQIRAPSTR